MKGSTELEERLATLRWVIELSKTHQTAFQLAQVLREREAEVVYVLEKTAKK